MITSAGKDVPVGWSDHHIVWIEAAMTLPKNQRTAAYQDVADMTGRTLTAVRCKAYWIAEQREYERLRLEAATARRVLVPIRCVPRNTRPEMAKSQLAPISRARLMGCR